MRIAKSDFELNANWTVNIHLMTKQTPSPHPYQEVDIDVYSTVQHDPKNYYHLSN